MLDDDQSGWTDLLVANDTQPNKLYRNQRNGTVQRCRRRGRPRFQQRRQSARRHGCRRGRFYEFRPRWRGHHQLRQRNDRALRIRTENPTKTLRRRPEWALASRNSLGFGCAFLDANLDGWLDLAVANGHIDETVRNIRGNVGYAQPPQLFLNNGKGRLPRYRRRNWRRVRSAKGRPRPGLSLTSIAMAISILLLTTNNGPAYLYRNDQFAGNRSIRFRLVGTKSNRDAIGATVRVVCDGLAQSRMVKSGSSYLSQSELPVTFGLEKRDRVERAVITWPSGRTEEFKNLTAGRCYECIEGKGIAPLDGYLIALAQQTYSTSRYSSGSSRDQCQPIRSLAEKNCWDFSSPTSHREPRSAASPLQ